MSATLAAAFDVVVEEQPAKDVDALLVQIRALEELKAAAAATQARLAVAYELGRRAQQIAAGVRAARVGAGVAHEVAAARRESPHRARRWLGFAQILTRELPATFAALQAGRTTEWRAMLLARETAWLSREHRLEADAELGPRLEGLGDREVEAEAKRIAYRLDPRGCVNRMKRAEGERFVSLRPAPDGMTWLSALLPLKGGIASIVALRAAADTARATGDERSRGQVMADTLMQRVTGHAPDAVPVQVNITLPASSFFGSVDEPADIDSYGPVPAPVARDLATRGLDDEAVMRIRRCFTDPTGRLITMETGSRTVTRAMGEFIRLRDRTCTTPWCAAPIRHTDHTRPWAEGGPTSLENTQGLCEACNYAKEHTRAGPLSLAGLT